MDNSILLEEFTAIGINHKRASVTVRECFSLSVDQQRNLLRDAAEHGIPGLLIVSTCNRTELLAHAPDAELISLLLVKHSGGTAEDFREFGFIKHGEDAVRHIFRVAVGLEAQILGDLQIIKQVKEGYKHAVDTGMADASLHRLMQFVSRTHKRSRNETSLGVGAATTAYAAVQLAKKEMQSFRGRKVLLVGAGKIGKVTCKNLISMGAADVTVVNRNPDRAEKLSNRFEIKISDFKNLDIEIARADLVIVATGAPQAVITNEHFELCDPDAGVKTLIDLSVPRNISTSVNDLSYVNLINMDMLNDRLDETFREREANVPQVEAIIEEEFEAFCQWMREKRVVPTIRALSDKLDAIRRAEVERFRNKLTEDTIDHVDHLTRRIVNKIMAHSIDHIKGSQEKQEEITKVIRDMYNISEENDS